MKFSSVIVDDRIISEESILRHIDYLPKDWDLVVFSRPDYRIDIPHKRRLYLGGYRPIKRYNAFLISEEFWLNLKEYDRVLIFQQDSGLLKTGIEDFLSWSYVGAPWKETEPWCRKDRAGGNGGLSIRSPRESLRVIKDCPWSEDMGNEDMYFTHRMDNVAPYEVCRKFSVESVFELGALGYHNIEKYLPRDQVDQIISQQT